MKKSNQAVLKSSPGAEIPTRIPVLSLSLFPWLLFGTALLASCPNLLVHAAFNVPLTSVRSASLGQASMASSNEAASLFLNPSGLAGLKQKELSLMYNRLYVGLPGTQDMATGYLALALPTRLGNFGLGLGGFMASGAKEERTVALGLARRFFGDRLELGLTAKHLFHSYLIGSDPLAQRDPVFSQGTSRSAVAFDVGVSAKIMGPLEMGIAARNINEPNVGLVTEDKVKREIQGGLVLHLQGIGLKASGDLSYRTLGNSARGKASAILPYFGLEKTLNNEGLALRLGANPLEFAGGLGMQLNNITFDYALILSRNLSLEDNQGTHRVGVSFKFGSSPSSSRTQDGLGENEKEEENFYKVFFEE